MLRECKAPLPSRLTAKAVQRKKEAEPQRRLLDLCNRCETLVRPPVFPPDQGASQMASQYPVGNHDDPTLFALEQAFYDVWTVLAAHEPYRDRTQDVERKMELSRTLMVLAANGVTDIAELRRLGFKSLSLPPSH